MPLASLLLLCITRAAASSCSPNVLAAPPATHPPPPFSTRTRKLHAAEAEARRQPLAVRIRQQLAHSMDSWRSYFAQPILPSSLTFVLLFFNVVLSPGGCVGGWGRKGRSSGWRLLPAD